MGPLRAALADGFTGDCQTKNLACRLDNYLIRKDGVVMVTECWCLGDEAEPQPKPSDLHGWVSFYGHEDVGDKTNWHQYRAKFNDGRLVEITTST